MWKILAMPNDEYIHVMEITAWKEVEVQGLLIWLESNSRIGLALEWFSSFWPASLASHLIQLSRYYRRSYPSTRTRKKIKAPQATLGTSLTRLVCIALYAWGKRKLSPQHLARSPRCGQRSNNICCDPTTVWRYLCQLVSSTQPNLSTSHCFR